MKGSQGLSKNIWIVLSVCFLFSSCSLLDICAPEASSTNGKATVGASGGNISIEDEESALDGVSIEIPQGALEESVEIEIVQGDEMFVNGETVQIIEFLPEGLEFKEPVRIGIPWSSPNQTESNSMIYYINEEDQNIEEVEIDGVDTENEISYGLVNHFSKYYNKIKYYYIASEVGQSQNEFTSNFRLYTSLYRITPLLLESPYQNAREIFLAHASQDECYVELAYSLWRMDNFENIRWLTAKQEFNMRCKKSGELWDVEVYRYNETSYQNEAVKIFTKTGLGEEQLFSEWVSGAALFSSMTKDCFFDENFILYPDERFQMSCTWRLLKKMGADITEDRWTHGFTTFTQFKKFNELELLDKDLNNNNIIDAYETGNAIPLAPTSPQPANYAEDVASNISLSWTCLDPDQDPLTYEIFFGESPNPVFHGTSNAESYTISGLGNGKTYQWFVTAYDDKGGESISQTWEFTTAEKSSSSIGCEGITSVEHEGKTYYTVEIGTQCWLTENMNVGEMVSGSTAQSDNGTIEKYCYNNDAANCETYGGLYQWNEVMQYSSSEKAQGVCPSGWHIPSSEEWKILEGNVDSEYDVGDAVWDNTTFRGSDAGKRLKSTSAWFLNGNGTDDYGFGVVPAGYRSEAGSFSDMGAGVYLWNSNKMTRMFAFNEDRIKMVYQAPEKGLPVRCIRD